MLNIPPGKPRHVVQSICSLTCLTSAIEKSGEHELKIVGLQQHMHLTGIAMKTETLHANGWSTPLGVFSEYSMLHQSMEMLPEPVLIHPGDALQVTCVYDSSNRSRHTLLGTSLVNEMCFSYLLITPGVPGFTHCWHDEQSDFIASSQCNGQCGLLPGGRNFKVRRGTSFKGHESTAATEDFTRDDIGSSGGGDDAA